MQDTCRILWVRHGETAWNTQKRFQGHLDIPLNDTGHQQARLLAHRLHQQHQADALPPSLRIDHLYASDLARAATTAQYIADALQLPLQTRSSLRERNYGDLAGLTSEEMAQRFPAEHERMLKRQPDAILPGGESLLMFYDRIISATHQLVAHHPGQTLCVVVHGGVLDCIYRHTLGIDLARPRQWLLANASLNTVDHGPKRWTIANWGDTAHLQQTAADEVDGRIV